MGLLREHGLFCHTDPWPTSQSTRNRRTDPSLFGTQIARVFSPRDTFSKSPILSWRAGGVCRFRGHDTQLGPIAFGPGLRGGAPAERGGEALNEHPAARPFRPGPSVTPRETAAEPPPAGGGSGGEAGGACRGSCGEPATAPHTPAPRSPPPVDPPARPAGQASSRPTSGDTPGNPRQSAIVQWARPSQPAVMGDCPWGPRPLG